MSDSFPTEFSCGVPMELREGDYIETEEGLFFHVKGILHPSDRAIAFLRYVPDSDGDREGDGKRYSKIYPLDERFRYLESKHPKYIFRSKRLGRKIQAVPEDSIEKVYRPEDKLEDLRNRDNLDSSERTALKLSEKILEHSGIGNEGLGVTGSVLLGLQLPDSDIDLVTYGEENGRAVYSALQEMRERGKFLRPYEGKDALRMAEFRWNETGLPLEKLAELESRKVLHGLVNERDFFMRLVKRPVDIGSRFEDFRYVSGERTKMRARVSDAGESIFTPNRYAVEDVPRPDGDFPEIESLVSYRGRFTEQASEGEKIEALGTVEKVIYRGEEEYYRLVLGHPEDYLVPTSFFTRGSE